MSTLVYDFNDLEKPEPSLLGGKGASLVTMTRLGLPVPPGFILTTVSFKKYVENGYKLPSTLWNDVLNAVRKLEESTGSRLGSPDAPLLLSVRSGASISMPGMMQTLLNVGLNDEVVAGLEAKYGRRFAAQNYSSLIHKFGVLVHGIEEDLFDQVERRDLDGKGGPATAKSRFTSLLHGHKQVVKANTGRPFEQDPLLQLRLAISAVFNSWQSAQARAYRQKFRIPETLGTAVVVQKMVFGNLDKHSGSGVIFTRDTMHGTPELDGEYLVGFQGEAIVGGEQKGQPIVSLVTLLPDVYRQLSDASRQLERHYKRVQDVEFTVESGRLWLLQSRNAPMSAEAAVKAAVQMVNEGVLTEEEALSHVTDAQIEQLMYPALTELVELQALEEGKLIAQGVSATTGTAIGRLVVTAEEAVQMSMQGEKAVLFRSQLAPIDVPAMEVAEGIISARGGVTSHAALVAKSMGKVCVMGCETLQLDLAQGMLIGSNQAVALGETLTVSGRSGRVFTGPLALEVPTGFPELDVYLSWRDAYGTRDTCWSKAIYSDEQSKTGYLEKAKTLSRQMRWTTEKAMVVEALKLLHPEMRIRQEVAAANDLATIRRQMHDVIRAGYWNGPRTCYYPHALGKAGWQMALDTKELVEAFLEDPQFDGFSRAGGYQQWIRDPNLREIITVYDPPRLGLPEFEHEHFVLTISCSSMPASIFIEMNIGTAQLRSIESANSWDLVHATMEIDTGYYHNRGQQFIGFGGKYLNHEIMGEIATSIQDSSSWHELKRKSPFTLLTRLDESVAEMIVDEVLQAIHHPSPHQQPLEKTVAIAITTQMRKGKVPAELYESLVLPIPLRLVTQALDRVWSVWWEAPFDLPARLHALARVFNLDVLEIQGRFASDGTIDYMLVYDAKGREETLVASKN